MAIQEPEFFEGKGLYDFQARVVGGRIVYERRPREQRLSQVWQGISVQSAPEQLVARALVRFGGGSSRAESAKEGTLGDSARV